MDLDPVCPNPDAYRVLFENERVRVLEYTDTPGHHAAPAPGQRDGLPELFRRRLGADGREVEVEIPIGVARCVGAQEHHGENTGSTNTHTVFVELEDAAPPSAPGSTLGPS